MAEKAPHLNPQRGESRPDRQGAVYIDKDGELFVPVAVNFNMVFNDDEISGKEDASPAAAAAASEAAPPKTPTDAEPESTAGPSEENGEAELEVGKSQLGLGSSSGGKRRKQRICSNCSVKELEPKSYKKCQKWVA